MQVKSSTSVCDFFNPLDLFFLLCFGDRSGLHGCEYLGCDKIIISLELIASHLQQGCSLYAQSSTSLHCRLQGESSFFQSETLVRPSCFLLQLFHLFPFIKYTNLCISYRQRRPQDCLRLFNLLCFIHEYFILFIQPQIVIDFKERHVHSLPKSKG